MEDMTGLEIGLMVGEAILVPAILYVLNTAAASRKASSEKFEKLFDAVKEIQLQLVKQEADAKAGDANTEKHILNCKNFEPRHNIKRSLD